ncbi:DUF2637 domain-containing protein [Streptomyces sp. NPDC003314]
MPSDRSGEDREQAPGVPPLTRWERYGAILTVLGGAAVGGLGFYASFDTVSLKAAQWGFTDPWVLPAAIDSAIPVFTVAYLLLIRTGMPLWWARLVPWALSLVTCALNVAAGTSLWSKIAHGAMSLLWVAVSEIAAHTYAVRIGAATGRRRQMDKVRWARWFLSPLPTFRLWRRMKLWELTSYDTALRLEQERLVYEAQLQARFGRGWRRKAPVEARLPLQLAHTGMPLAQTAYAGLCAAGIEPADIFAPPQETKTLPPVEEAPVTSAPAEETLALPPAPTPAAPAPVAAVAAAARRSRVVTASVSLHKPESEPEPAPAEAPAAMPPADSTGQEAFVVPAWTTEEELREIIGQVLDGGHRDAFDGPLTGAAIAEVFKQSEGNGRKIRARLIKEYAAEKGVELPQPATVDAVLGAFDRAKTAASA